MKITVNGKNIDVTTALRDTVIKKIGKLGKHFSPDVEAYVMLSVQKNTHTVEVTIPFNGMILRSEEATSDMYISIDNIVEKLERQIVKHKTRLEKRKRVDSLKYLAEALPSEVAVDEDDYPSVVRTKKFAMKPMPLEEALLQMDLLGHSFYMFKNVETGEVNLVYKRKDGRYGLIEPA